MRTTATCPKCSGKKIIVTDLRHTHYSARRGESLETIPAVSVAVRGFFGGTRVCGGFESWICAACGYTEFYAKDLDLDDVDRLAAQWPEDIRIVDSAAPKRGPFR
jgi:predicted nucleic-acid-binding Zn-ribbon protein